MSHDIITHDTCDESSHVKSDSDIKKFRIVCLYVAEMNNFYQDFLAVFDTFTFVGSSRKIKNKI